MTKTRTPRAEPPSSSRPAVVPTDTTARLGLNDLPAWSPWPARILGLDGWEPTERTIAKIESEYNQDKYAKCLAYYRNNQNARTVTIEEVRDFECGGLARQTACSIGNEILQLTLREVQSRYRRLLAETMADAVAGSDIVVELGCGYGIQLWYLRQAFPAKPFVGGEYSENAVALADKLYGTNSGICVRRFNFYDDDYGYILSVGKNKQVVIFTSHAIEQLPSSATAIDKLVRYADRIHRVLHFEPIPAFYGDSLLGLMRRRYAELNGYNRDLLAGLQRRSDVHIFRTTPNVIGQNPLHPVSVVEWAFQ